MIDRFRRSEAANIAIGAAYVTGGAFAAICFLVGLADVLMKLSEVF